MAPTDATLADHTATRLPAFRNGGFAGFSVTLCVALVVSAQIVDTRLGAPLYWAWLITALQVTGLWAAGRRRWWGWLLGASVQPPWIVYAVLTGQLGFIPGCVVSGAVQLASFLRHENPRPHSSESTDQPCAGGTTKTTQHTPGTDQIPGSWDNLAGGFRSVRDAGGTTLHRSPQGTATTRRWRR